MPLRPTRRLAVRLAPRAGSTGLTLIELVVAFSLMLILSVMALPVARVKVQREKERRLRDALKEIRVAIDRYKDMADEGGLVDQDPDNYGYPESLEAMVEGVEVEQEDRFGAGLPTSEQGTPSRRDGRSRQDGLGTRRGSRSQLGQSRSLGSQGRSMDQAFPGQSSSRTGTGFGRMGARDPLREEDPLADEEGPEAIRFLRAIPMDPMTGRREWGMLSVSDDPRSRSWNGRNVFDVYSLSTGIALDGTTYADW